MLDMEELERRFLEVLLIDTLAGFDYNAFDYASYTIKKDCNSIFKSGKELVNDFLNLYREYQMEHDPAFWEHKKVEVLKGLEEALEGNCYEQ